MKKVKASDYIECEVTPVLSGPFHEVTEEELNDLKTGWIFFNTYSVQKFRLFNNDERAINCAGALFQLGAAAVKLWPRGPWPDNKFRVEAVWDKDDVDSLLDDGKYILK